MPILVQHRIGWQASMGCCTCDRTAFTPSGIAHAIELRLTHPHPSIRARATVPAFLSAERCRSSRGGKSHTVQCGITLRDERLVGPRSSAMTNRFRWAPQRSSPPHLQASTLPLPVQPTDCSRTLAQDCQTAMRAPITARTARASLALRVGDLARVRLCPNSRETDCLMFMRLECTRALALFSSNNCEIGSFWPKFKKAKPIFSLGPVDCEECAKCGCTTASQIPWNCM